MKVELTYGSYWKNSTQKFVRGQIVDVSEKEANRLVVVKKYAKTYHGPAQEGEFASKFENVIEANNEPESTLKPKQKKNKNE